MSRSSRAFDIPPPPAARPSAASPGPPPGRFAAGPPRRWPPRRRMPVQVHHRRPDFRLRLPLAGPPARTPSAGPRPRSAPVVRPRLGSAASGELPGRDRQQRVDLASTCCRTSSCATRRPPPVPEAGLSPGGSSARWRPPGPGRVRRGEPEAGRPARSEAGRPVPADAGAEGGVQLPDPGFEPRHCASRSSICTRISSIPAGPEALFLGLYRLVEFLPSSACPA